VPRPRVRPMSHRRLAGGAGVNGAAGWPRAVSPSGARLTCWTLSPTLGASPCHILGQNGRKNAGLAPKVRPVPQPAPGMSDLSLGREPGGCHIHPAGRFDWLSGAPAARGAGGGVGELTVGQRYTGGADGRHGRSRQWDRSPVDLAADPAVARSPGRPRPFPVPRIASLRLDSLVSRNPHDPAA
jgi:hypothetical protein